MLRHRWIDHRMKWYILPKMVEFFEWPLQAALWRHKPFFRAVDTGHPGTMFYQRHRKFCSLYSLDMVDTTLYYTILQYMPEELFDAFTMLWLPAVVVDSWLIENGWILQRLWFQQCFNSTAGNLPICSTACSEKNVDSKSDDRKGVVPRLYHLNRIRWVFPCRTMRPPLQRVAMLWTLLAWAGKDEIYVTWCGMQCLSWKRWLIALEDGTKNGRWHPVFSCHIADRSFWGLVGLQLQETTQERSKELCCTRIPLYKNFDWMWLIYLSI